MPRGRGGSPAGRGRGAKSAPRGGGNTNTTPDPKPPRSKSPHRGGSGHRGRGGKKNAHRSLDPTSPAYHIQIDRQASDLQESNFEPFLQETISTIITQVKEIRKTAPGRIVPVNLSLERNKINDVAIEALVNALIPLAEWIDLHIIRLHMNSIHDAGIRSLARLFDIFAITELHLSHNYITFDGFLALYHAVLQSDHYPLGSQKSPLWLRLEYNLIDAKQLEEHLRNDSLSAMVCSVPRRGVRKGQCSIHFCAHHPKFGAATKGKDVSFIRLHVPYIHVQKQSLKNLCTIKSVTTPKKSASKKKARDGSSSLRTSHKAEDMVGDDDSLDSDDGAPLLVVLDTCTIITMSHGSDFFTFADLLKRKKEGTMGDDIRFILVDTVFQQLDARKKETRNPSERICIRQFVDEILSEATKVNLLHYIHPMELEDEVRARGGHIGKQNFRQANGKFDSDGLILDCAHYLMEQSPNNVMVLTDDIPCKARALINQLPAETLRHLRKSLSSTAALTRHELARSCSEETCRVFGKNKQHVGSPKPRASLISELTAATELVQKLSILLRESLNTNPNEQLQPLADECFAEAQQSIVGWTQLVESHQNLRRFTQDLHSSPSKSPTVSLFDSPHDFTVRRSEVSVTSTTTVVAIPMGEDNEEESEDEALHPTLAAPAADDFFWEEEESESDVELEVPDMSAFTVAAIVDEEVDLLLDASPQDVNAVVLEKDAFVHLEVEEATVEVEEEITVPEPKQDDVSPDTSLTPTSSPPTSPLILYYLTLRHNN